MRTLSFLVNEQKISKDPKCDFSNIFPDTKGYLQAKFIFGRGWKNCKVAASFWCLGKEYQYIVEDVETKGDNIEFSWLLSRKVTMYRGTVNFVVCAVKVSGETIQNEWNTTLATSQVLEGLEVDTPEPTEEQSDVIAQLMQLVQMTAEQAVQDVREAEQEAITKISAIPTVRNHIITFGTDSKGGD